MGKADKPKSERLRSAAVVKVKYLLTAGKLDAGFEFIFKGVLEDLKLTQQEVDAYIEQNEEELTRLCMDGG